MSELPILICRFPCLRTVDLERLAPMIEIDLSGRENTTSEVFGRIRGRELVMMNESTTVKGGRNHSMNQPETMTVRVTHIGHFRINADDLFEPSRFCFYDLHFHCV